MKTNKTKSGTLEGTISLSSKGVGYLSSPLLKEDIEIDHEDLKTALNGDRVSVLVLKKNGSRQKGRVVKILNRAKLGFAGVLYKNKDTFFVKADDSKMYKEIRVSKKDLFGAKIGEKVFVEISHWQDQNSDPTGVILRTLGKPGDNNTEMLSIVMEKGFIEKLPKEVEDEAKAIEKRGITKSDTENRKDFRKITTFTIDPEDAKDFDDAISFRFLEESTYEVGVHIADVSHYVKPGSKLDKEAQKRATSVYLVDRTIPMLPEALSNNLCSLVPHQDRLTMSVVMTIDKEARVKSCWFGKAVINSQKRFTYEEAEHSIKKPGTVLHKELSILNHIAKKLTKDRFIAGAMSLEQEEIKFILDSNGKPIKVVKKERGDSNKMIEEFMLLANKKVAEEISRKSKNSGGGFVYRIHGSPDKEKMADLAFFLSSLGHKVSLKNGVIPAKEINKILESLEGKDEKGTVSKAVVRSMAKAIYSTKNIGHYGLAFTHYTHFTSPIRRYPDIIVHRILEEYLENKKIRKEDIYKYDEISLRSSEQEKKAAEAERASIKYKEVEYMSTRIGQKFDGVISGITEWGIYAEEKETKCEGMIKLRDLRDDFFIFNQRKMELVGEKTKKRYRLGDKIKIQLVGTDLERRTIDYKII